MKLKKLLELIPAKFLFRLSYLANNFRDPFLRQCEQQLGLTRPETTILFCLATTDGITAKDVSDVTRQPKNTLSRGALMLEDKALITRESDPGDRRRSILHITPKGIRLYEDYLLPFYQEQERLMLAPLNESELDDLDRVMTLLCSHVAAKEETD